MQNIKFPVDFTFKIGTLANDFAAVDADGHMVAYVRQKMFKLKEDIEIFDNDAKSKLLYRIKADRWLDFSSAYNFSDAAGNPIGKVARKGWKSLLKAEYVIIDQKNEHQYRITEENPWIKVADNLLGAIPVLGVLTGYFFNPSYAVVDNDKQIIARLKKQASFWGRKFRVTKTGKMDSDDDDRILLSLMMMILLERQRG